MAESGIGGLLGMLLRAYGSGLQEQRTRKELEARQQAGGINLPLPEETTFFERLLGGGTLGDLGARAQLLDTLEGEQRKRAAEEAQFLREQEGRMAIQAEQEKADWRKTDYFGRMPKARGQEQINLDRQRILESQQKARQAGAFANIWESIGGPPGTLPPGALPPDAPPPTTPESHLQRLQEKLGRGVSLSGGGLTITGQPTSEQLREDVITKEGAKTVSPIAQREMRTLGTAEAQFNVVADNFDPAFVGPIAGRATELRRMVPSATPGLGLSDAQQVFYQALGRGGNAFLRGESGMVINEAERADLEKLNPKVTDHPDVFVPALAYAQSEATRLREEAELLANTPRDRYAEVLTGIRAHRKARYAAMLKDLKEKAAAAGTKTQAAPKRRVEILSSEEAP